MDTDRWAHLGELDRLYVEILDFGLFTLRDAICVGEYEWARILSDFLHNIPSLIGETNALRHRYFWEGERTLYIERISALGSEDALSHMRTYYEPIWDAMGPLIP